MSYSAQVLADAPVGYWKLDETAGTTAADSSGNGFDGTYGGTFDSAHFELGVAPLIAQGHAAQSHGTSNGGAFVSIPTESAFSTGGHITLEAWVELTRTGIQPMISSDNGSGTGRYFQFRLNAGKPEVILGDTGGTLHTFTGPAAINDGLRHHVVATYDGAHVVIYVDGTAVLTTAATFALRTTNAGLMLLEQLPGVSNAQYQGVFDEAAIYTTALSAARVLAHYNARDDLPVATFAGSSSLAATLRALRRILATIVGTSTLTATLVGFKRIAATIAGTSSLTATVAGLRRFIGTIAGTSSLAASFTGLKRFTATISGSSSLSGTVGTGSSTVNIPATITGQGSLRAQFPVSVPTAVRTLTVDTPNVMFTQALRAGLSLRMDTPTIGGATQTPTASRQLKADPPTLGGLVSVASSATRQLRMDPPSSPAPEPTARLTLRVGTPTAGPTTPPTAKRTLRVDVPDAGPRQPGSGRLLLTFSAPVQAGPVQPPTAARSLKMDPPIFGDDGIRLHDSGILRLRMDTPVLPALTEPLPPPPPPPGSGISATATF